MQITKKQAGKVIAALVDATEVIKYSNEEDTIGFRCCCDVLSYEPHHNICTANNALSIMRGLAECEPVAQIEDRVLSDAVEMLSNQHTGRRLRISRLGFEPQRPSSALITFTDSKNRLSAISASPYCFWQAPSSERMRSARAASPARNSPSSL